MNCKCEVTHNDAFILLCEFHRKINDTSVARIREQIAEKIEEMPFKPAVQTTIKSELIDRRDAAAIARGQI